MRIPVIAGNWKMNKLVSEARALARAIKEGSQDVPDRRIVLAPPATALSAVADEIRGSSLVLAAQHVHWERQGAFTGEISIPMIEDVGCKMVIVGHSERRQFFGETHETVNRRVLAIVQSQLQAIVCVGETLAERNSGQHQEIVRQQLKAGLDGLTRQNLLRIMLAYEPVWAIGTGHTASPELAQEMHAAMRQGLARYFGEEAV
jgi:triosephosphate isomerase (TIM)